MFSWWEVGVPEVVRVGAEEERTEPVTSGGGRWGPRGTPAPETQPAKGGRDVTNRLLPQRNTRLRTATAASALSAKTPSTPRR